MNELKQLLLEARQRRNAAISQARRHYDETVLALKQASREKHVIVRLKPRKRKYRGSSNHGGDYSKMTTRQAAELVLMDCGPMTLTEITIEVMRRGCRSGECPRAVSQSIRSSLFYHQRQGQRFSRDGEGRWVVS